MKIILITHLKLHGCLRSYNFGQTLARMGHEVTHVSISHQSRFKIRTTVDNGMKIIETPDFLWGRARSGWDPWDVINRLLYLTSNQNGKIDIVHGFECRPVTIYPILVLKNIYKDIIFISDWNDWWGRGGLISEKRPFWYKPIFGSLETYFEEAFRTRADGITVITPALGERAQTLGVAREKWIWIPQGVDPDFLKFMPIHEARQQIGIPDNIKLAIFSGGDVIIDLDLVLLSFVKVCKEFPKAKLMLLGRKSPLTHKIGRKYGIEDKILEMGMIPYQDYPKYLACADVLLLPFKNKIANIGRWPTKLGEYMSIGRPIVSNPVSNIKGLFESNKIGLLAAETPDDFAAKIIHLFENPKLCEECGNNARRVAEQQFAWQVLTKKLENFYLKYI